MIKFYIYKLYEFYVDNKNVIDFVIETFLTL